MANILVGGIVAYRDKRPYVQIDVDGHMVQLSVAEARSVAVDIFRQASRAEADAMIYKFFAEQRSSRGRRRQAHGGLPNLPLAVGPGGGGKRRVGPGRRYGVALLPCRADRQAAGN